MRVFDKTYCTLSPNSPEHFTDGFRSVQSYDTSYRRDANIKESI